MRLALALVTMTSLWAFTAAVVLMSLTTGTPGWRALSARRSLAVMASAREQPASWAGSRTSLSGLRSLAVSAMKRTPQNTMRRASIAEQSLASL